MQDYSLKIAEAIEEFLKNDDWNFDATDENGIIRFGIKLRCKFQHADIRVRVRQDSYLVLTTLPVTADEDSRAKVLDFINRANYGFVHGNFEMDPRDGELRFRTSQNCGRDILINSDIIKESIYLNLSMVERYGTPLMKVMMGVATPEEAIEEAEGDGSGSSSDSSEDGAVFSLE